VLPTPASTQRHYKPTTSYDKKGKKKFDEGNNDFQESDKTVNVHFGGLPIRRSQKATLREVSNIEPAVPTPLRWSEVPITFYRVDQWTSFSEPRRFPLVLKLVVTGSRLNQVLIDSGSGLNVFFTKTLKKMKLDITDILTKSVSLFYCIVLGNATIPLCSVVLPVTFWETRENYRIEYIKFGVADFETSYHAILGRPAIAKFMAVLHYTYLEEVGSQASSSGSRREGKKSATTAVCKREGVGKGNFLTR
jgi:hypothetical protein